MNLNWKPGANPTAAEIEEQLLKILTENRPGTEIRGCHGHMEVYDHLIHERILLPLLKARCEAGLIGKIDDLGHDLPFAEAWNRTVEGKSEKWDCRWLALPIVRGAVLEVPHEKFFSDDFDAIDEALLRNLPGILAGTGMKPVTCDALRSWVDGSFIYLRMDDYQPILGSELCQDQAPPPSFRAALDTDLPEEAGFEMYGLMSFYGDGIDHDEGDKAWSAWRNAAEEQGLLKRGYYDSMAAMMVRSIMSADKMGIFWQQLRQDESVSVESGPDGLTVYRGAIHELKAISDEGQFLSGPRSAFMEILEKGGFSKAGAGHYLDRLAETSSAFRATVPAGSRMRCLIDPETLYAFDMPDDVMIYDTEKEDALPILAAGTFGMPEMLTHRARKAAKMETGLEPTP